MNLETAMDIIGSIFLLAGLFFMLVGAIGIVRFPDAYNRLHASSKCSTLGLLGMLLGAVFHIGTIAVTTKAALTILFAFVATPVGSHILAKAAHIDGLKQWDETLSDDLEEDQDYSKGSLIPPPGESVPDRASSAPPVHAAAATGGAAAASFRSVDESAA